ncbi:P-type conjugative transfer protein TrbJ [uncultured Bartonella sp.]|uniref:P-type conjugative transfer protein TrbJ n=1 Tax=uncultured Bartonella sp. TaxID=104108 RepID=UPI0026270778|nr:P-type conjugative transfer protein TrbJ [uncultured Bartonella sp.]
MTFRSSYILPALIAAVTLAEPVQALTVFDPSNYTQNVLSAPRALEQINNQIKSLQNQAQMLINQTKNLTQLDYNSLLKLQDNIAQTQMLLKDAQNISYNVKNIDEQFRTTYGEADMSASDKKLVEDARQRLRNTVGGIQDSMRVQAQVVDNIENNKTETKKLVEKSQSAEGSLQALQAGNQLLSVLATQISDLIAISALSGRAADLEAAERAAAAEQGREQRRRFLQRGPAYNGKPSQ